MIEYNQNQQYEIIRIFMKSSHNMLTILNNYMIVTNVLKLEIIIIILYEIDSRIWIDGIMKCRLYYNNVMYQNY